MYVRTTTPSARSASDDSPGSTSSAVCSRWPRRTRSRLRRPLAASRRRFARRRPGRSCSASAVAYGATTRSSPSPRFKPEPGHAERLVLIVVRADRRRCRPTRRCPRARRVGGRTRSAGGRRAGTSRRAACPGYVAHQQQRHQVLEHRGAPRQQRRRAADADATDRPRWNQCVCGTSPRGDRDEARESGLRRQQVVVRGIEPARTLGCRRAGSRWRRAGASSRRGTRSSSASAKRRARSASRSSRDLSCGSAAIPSSPLASVTSDTDEIAAVHGGHVGRRQRGQCSRVVPVEEMAFVALQPFARGRACARSGRPARRVV